MSLIAYRKDVKRPVASARIDWAPVTFSTSTIITPVQKAIVRAAKLLGLVVEAIVEARMQRAKIEVELYRNRYKHSSKNDDDLPIVH